MPDYCNRCMLVTLGQTAAATMPPSTVEIRLRGDRLPARLDEQEQYSGPVGHGYDIFFNHDKLGTAWVMWLSHLENRCTCGAGLVATTNP